MSYAACRFLEFDAFAAGMVNHSPICRLRSAAGRKLIRAISSPNSRT